jgi:hypothetical protein
MRLRCLASIAPASFVLLAACGGGGDPIEDYYPELPEPTGDAQVVFAGEITQANQNELVTGPAATGLAGDLFIRNDKAAFIISAPTRVIGVVPQGGNVIDVVLRDASGQLVPDHFGELALLYVLGRTCEHDSVEIIRDGTKGGIAAIRAHGHSGNDDFLNIKGIGLFNVETEIDPDIDDGVECATTYVLAPGATTLQVYFTMYNPTDDNVQGPMGTLADTGGTTESWGNLRGFERLSLSLDAFSNSAPLDYTVYQGPGVSYGIVPRDPVPVASSAYLIAGVSIFLFGNDSLLDILDSEQYYLHLDAKKGLLQAVDLVVGRDAEDIDVAWRTGKGEALTAVGGTVAWSGGGAPAGARVGIYRDDNGNGQIDDPAVPDTIGGDLIISYMDVAADGTFAGQAPAGNLLLRAEVKNQGRSAASPAGAQVALTIPSPVRLDFSIVDDQTNMEIPGRLLVVGDHTAYPDRRVFETYDRQPGIVDQRHSIRGSSTLGSDPDPAFYLPAGGDYRVYASRGTEWSAASQPFSATADGEVTLRLRHVAPATGYLSTEWHVHHVGSPDSPVPADERVKSAVSAGVEMFAITDHDYIADLQPLAEQMAIDDLVRILPGIEVTPFAYGHFNAWPMEVDNASPNKGAIDWARGMTGFAMTPGEIYAAMRERGARMVQVNHPRGSGFSEFQSFFDRANLTYDYTNRTIFGDFAGASVPNDFLRLPGVSLWDDTFNGLEVWNGFGTKDSDADGTLEIQSLDRVMRDWFNMLSLGMVVTPLGNSDTHNSVIDPVGMPRTYVRVPDDSAAGLQSGASVEPVLGALTGITARDVIITDGPLIEVTSAGDPAIGQTVAASGGTVTLQVTLTSPEWAEIDTLEVFANSTPDIVGPNDLTALTPLHCWTTRNLGTLDPADRCVAAPIAPESITIPLTTLPGPGAFKRYQTTITVSLDVADIALATRAGATGQDAWLVFRVRGNRGLFPVMTQQITVDAAMLAVLLAGDPDELATELQGKGVTARAFTGPIFVDFDGGGYRAPFAPQ